MERAICWGLYTCRWLYWYSTWSRMIQRTIHVGTARPMASMLARDRFQSQKGPLTAPGQVLVLIAPWSHDTPYSHDFLIKQKSRDATSEFTAEAKRFRLVRGKGNLGPWLTNEPYPHSECLSNLPFRSPSGLTHSSESEAQLSKFKLSGRTKKLDSRRSALPIGSIDTSACKHAWADKIRCRNQRIQHRSKAY